MLGIDSNDCLLVRSNFHCSLGAIVSLFLLPACNLLNEHYNTRTSLVFYFIFVQKGGNRSMVYSRCFIACGRRL